MCPSWEGIAVSCFSCLVLSTAGDTGGMSPTTLSLPVPPAVVCVFGGVIAVRAASVGQQT